MSSPVSIPLFEPSSSSTIVKVSHQCEVTIRTKIAKRLISLFLWRQGRRGPISHKSLTTTPGPQNVEALLDGAKARLSAAGMEFYNYPLDAALLEDSRLRLDGWKLMCLQQSSQKANIARTILFFAGGGFVNPTLDLHITMLTAFCKQLSVTTPTRIIIVPYELAPHATAALNYLRFVAIFEQVRREAKNLGHEVLLLGDSAGGGISAAMPYAIRTLLPSLVPASTPLTDEEVLAHHMPDQIVLIAPAIDGVMEATPLTQHIQQHDIVLTIPRCQTYLRAWAQGRAAIPGFSEYDAEEADANVKQINEQVPDEALRALLPKDASHPLIASCRHAVTMETLKAASIRVVVQYGTHDLLYEAGLAYLKGLENAQVSCRYIEGVDGQHDYPLLALMSESPEGIKLIVEAINANATDARN